MSYFNGYGSSVKEKYTYNIYSHNMSQTIFKQKRPNVEKTHSESIIIKSPPGLTLLTVFNNVFTKS